MSQVLTRSINLTNRLKTLSCESIETLSMFVICCHFLGSKAIITTTVCRLHYSDSDPFHLKKYMAIQCSSYKCLGLLL